MQAAKEEGCDVALIPVAMLARQLLVWWRDAILLSKLTSSLWTITCPAWYVSSHSHLFLSRFFIYIIFKLFCFISFQTGPVATAEMRRWGYTGPIIGLSGDTDVSAFLEAGANAALVKPINKVQMERVLRQHLPS